MCGEAFAAVPRDPGGRLVAVSESFVAYISPSSEYEFAALSWAKSWGIPVPSCVHHADDVLVVRRVADDAQVGSAFATCAIDAAAAIAAADPASISEFSALQPPRRRVHKIRDTARTLRRVRASPVGIHQFRQLRNAVAEMAHDTVCHGDFHTTNLLYDRDNNALHVIDWESLTLAPRGTDLARLWPTMQDPEVRERVLGSLQDTASDTWPILLRWWSAYHSVAATELQPDLAVLAHDRFREAVRISSV